MLRKIAAMIVGGLALSASMTAQAEDKPASQPSSWWDTFSISGHIEGGLTFNTYPQNNGLNFGQLFTDKTNTPLLNQALVTVQRPIDPKSPNVDFGFKLQAYYGTDARYTRFLGQFEGIEVCPCPAA